MKYYVNGRPVRESTGTEKETEARKVLKTKDGRAASGQPLLPRTDRITYDELAADLVRHYRTTGERDLGEAGRRLTHLARFFTGRRVVTITPPVITEYVEKRQAEPTNRGGLTSNRTINLELGVLGRMFRLACENGKLFRVPPIKTLKEAPPRQGFFEEEQYRSVWRRLPADLQVAAEIGHTYGWRIRSEVLTLALSQVDLKAGTIRLDPGQAKNDEGRLVYLTPELSTLLAAQVDRVKALMRERGAVIPFLFPHLTGPHQGKRRLDFVKRWKTACRQASCPGMLKHDLRRTAVRNMVNRGASEKVAMTATGHKTRSVFDRYHIVSPGDLQELARKLAGTATGTAHQMPLDAVAVSMRECSPGPVVQMDRTRAS